jgi:hypothetical protein
MSRPFLGAALLLAAALAPAPARALVEGSPISGSFQLQAGGYRPNVDEGLVTQPYQTSFGSGRPVGGTLLYGRMLPWRTAGTVELGLGAGWWQASGHAVDAAGVPTVEKTTFRIIPMQLSLTYRADFFWDRWAVPVIPYGRASLLRYAWRVTGAGGAVEKTGATDGYAFTGGLGFVLNFIDPLLSRELDADSGINYTMLTAEVTKTKVNDFGSKYKSWDLSDTQLTYTFGLLFVF